VTVALPSKPFSGRRETDTLPEVPGDTETLDGLILIVNEGELGTEAGADPPPPQPVTKRIPARMKTTAEDGGVRTLLPQERSDLRRI
jgi:hypothetical protein